MTYDSRVATLLEALAQCVCQANTDDGLPDLCFCGIYPGAQVAADYAGNCKDKCGMKWVRLSTAYPSVVTGVADATPNNCGKGLGLDVEIGSYRCISAGDARGNPPSQAELLEAAELQYADMLSIRKAVSCCTVLDQRAVIMSSYTPQGPQGGIVGGFWTIVLSLD